MPEKPISTQGPNLASLAVGESILPFSPPTQRYRPKIDEFSEPFNHSPFIARIAGKNARVT